MLGSEYQIETNERQVMNKINTLTPAEQEANRRSHRIGNVDDCRRCIYCEVGVWNAHLYRCV